MFPTPVGGGIVIEEETKQGRHRKEMGTYAAI
jgi:hypothetical protein